MTHDVSYKAGDGGGGGWGWGGSGGAEAVGGEGAKKFLRSGGEHDVGG